MKIIILGAGGHGRSALDIFSLDKKAKVLGFLDSSKDLRGRVMGGVKVLGEMELLEGIKKKASHFFVAVGDNRDRKMLTEQAEKAGLKPASAIHPSAIISKECRIGDGAFIGASSIIGPNVTLGKSVVVNCNATIPHNNFVADYANISPGVHMGGGTTIGEGSFVGVGVSLIQYIHIGKNVLIGAGTVVIKDVPDDVVIAGIPARVLRKNV